jgi:hypothetical protein
MADEEEFNPAKMAAATMRRLAKELDAGALSLVAFSFSDKATVKFSCQLALPRSMAPVASEEPSSAAAPAPRDRCPKCGAKEKPQDCGLSPGSAPPMLDLMCVRCQHVWQVPPEV